MIQDVLSHISGVEIYGVLSICLFFAAFLGVLFWALGLDKPYLDTMRELPLIGNDAPPDARAARGRPTSAP